MTRLTTAELAIKARITGNAHGHDFLSVYCTPYHSRSLAKTNTNTGGSQHSLFEITRDLESLPLLSVVTHHWANKTLKMSSETQYKKVATDGWVTV